MSRRSLSIIVVVLFCSILMGCSSEKFPIDTVAVVGGKAITEEQIKNEIVERNIAIRMMEKLSEQNPSSSRSPKSILLQAMNIKEEDSIKEQKRYIESLERSTFSPLTENEAFNSLLRQEVLYLVACKQGYEVSQERALKVLKEGDEQTELAVVNDEKALERYHDALIIEDEVIRKFGFESWDAYQKNRSYKLSQAMSINFMRGKFKGVFDEKLQNTAPMGSDEIIAEANAWDDYTEFLLKGAKSKLVNDKYKLQLYGEPWGYGELNLGSK